MAMQPDSVAPKPLAELTAIRRDILSIVSKNDGAAGTGIKTELEAAYDSDEISPAQVYPALDALADRGLVNKAADDGRTNSYSITERGERALRAHASWYGNGDSDV